MEAARVSAGEMEGGWSRRYHALPMLRFSFASSLLSFLPPAVLAMVILKTVSILIPEPATTVLSPATDLLVTPAPELSRADHAVVLFAGSVLLAPLWETAVWMVLVPGLLLKFVRSARMVVAVGAALFAAVHLSNSVQSAVMTVWPGIVWVHASVHWHARTGSWWQAYQVAFGAHALHNLCYFLLSFVPASLIL